MTGCRHGAKNTLVKNFLYLAEKLGTKIMPLTKVVNIEQAPNGYTLTIGDHVTVGHSAILHGCSIGNDVLIGMGSIVLDDVVIEDNVMVGAGSLVTSGKRLESGYLYLGSPAKQVRALTPDEITGLRYSAEHYIRVKNNFLITEASDTADTAS